MILRRYCSLLALATTAATFSASAQTATTPARKPTAPATATPHTTTAGRPAATAAPTSACAKLPELSPKLPALPAGLPCAKHLYTVSTVPPARLEYVAPEANSSQIAKTLGIESTSFSVDYVDTKIGTGAPAVPNKWYSIHYTGYLTDGTKFDSSLDRNEPITIHYGAHQVIPGWDTGFEGMRVGGKRRLFIPYQLAYGAQGKPPVIPPSSMLIFDVELVSISDTEPAPKPAPPADKPASDPAAKPATTPPPADPTKPETTPKPQGL
jgi:peptidylprolyl isomerase